MGEAQDGDLEMENIEEMYDVNYEQETIGEIDDSRPVTTNGNMVKDTANTIIASEVGFTSNVKNEDNVGILYNDCQTSHQITQGCRTWGI